MVVQVAASLCPCPAARGAGEQPSDRGDGLCSAGGGGCV